MTIRALFVDIGGVLLTNGWDTDTRKAAVGHFHLDAADIDSRHRMLFDTFEVGKLSLKDYLDRVIFYKKRSFTPAEFREWMFTQYKAFADMIDLVMELKSHYGLKIAVVSNEGRELTEYRIKKFALHRFVDFFVCSSFVHLRKPDKDIYRLALDLTQVKAQEVAYLEDRALFAEVAQSLGIHSVLHKSYKDTTFALAKLGLIIGAPGNRQPGWREAGMRDARGD